MKRTIALFSVLLALCLPAGLASAQAPAIPSEVQEAAEQGLDEFKARVASNPAPFGFADEEQVGHATLGPGYRLHRLLDGDGLRNASGDSLLALVTPIPEWLYTVDVGGASKGFLVVGLQSGQYQVVQGGGFTPDYGVALGNFRLLMAAQGASVEPVLIQVVTDYYLAARVGDREFVLPAVSTERARQGFCGGMDYTRLRPARDVVQYLQSLQQEGAGGQAGVGGAGSPDAGQETSGPSTRPQVWFAALGLVAAGMAVAGVLAGRRRASSRPG